MTDSTIALIERTPEQIIGKDALVQLIFEGYQVVPATELSRYEEAERNIISLREHLIRTEDEALSNLARAELAERQRDEALKEVQRLRMELTDTIARTANANAKRLRAARDAMGEPE